MFFTTLLSTSSLIRINTLATSHIVHEKILDQSSCITVYLHLTYQAWVEPASLWIKLCPSPGTETGTCGPVATQSSEQSSTAVHFHWTFYKAQDHQLPCRSHQLHYLQWVIVVLSDLFIFLLDVLEVFFPLCFIQELWALNQREQD